MRATYKSWQKISSSEIRSCAPRSFDVVVVNTFFDEKELLSSVEVNQKEVSKRITPTIDLIKKAASLLKDGGLLFVYGLPRHLPFYSVYLNDTKIDDDYFLFKYWIAVEFKPINKDLQLLPSSHVGLLMYLKTKSLEVPTPFHLNTKNIRAPHKRCTYCGLNVKDWGGKKHLLNKLGAAISDVWNGFDESVNHSSKIPDACLRRIYKLTKKEEKNSMLVVEQKKVSPLVLNLRSDSTTDSLRPFMNDAVIRADSIKLMREYVDKYPEGPFDFVFADPPYNLSKNYNEYSDARSDKEYVSWCNEWLDLMRRILRPGGVLFVLNIPKWAVYHAEFLNKTMEFRNWIVWDALSSPAGKLMPAHYSLLFYTKPGGKAVSNYDSLAQIDSREYCLRASCVNKRKKYGADRKEPMTDIWHDIHRIKHKRDRDSHPCQLPIKLMTRLIELTTKSGDWVFDPFGGAGTTAVAARLCGRHFIISDMDDEYVKISRRNLNKIKASPSGERYIERNRVSRPRKLVVKKTVETAFISICKQKRQVLSKDELRIVSPELFQTIENYYPDYSYLTKIAKRFMEIDRVASVPYQARLINQTAP